MVASFCRSRGLALGLTQAGIGVAVALIPPLIAIVIARQGRRSGFLALAAIAALGLLTAQVALPRDRAEPRAEPVEGTGGDPELALEVIRRSPAYRLQLVAFSAMALAFAGMLAHFMPMLRDAGMPLERAGALAGLIGRSVIVTRILVGRLADLVEPAWLAAVGWRCAPPAACCWRWVGPCWRRSPPSRLAQRWAPKPISSATSPPATSRGRPTVAPTPANMPPS